MGSKGPSWADQWDEGGDEILSRSRSNGGSSSKKIVEVKAAASAGFDKAKAAACAGAQKMKSGTSLGLKWVKNQYQKKCS